MNKSASSTSRSISLDRGDAATSSRDGSQNNFFYSPGVEEAWYRAAYRQAVNAKTWHLGDAVDDETRNVILAGLGGATPPMYQGPDNRYYFQNARTLEDAATRIHRARYFAGRNIEQTDSAKMPGEDEYVAMRRVYSRPANDNRVPAEMPNFKRSAQGVDCSQERAECGLLCRTAQMSPSMAGIWGGSFERCMNGCLPAACGGNPVG